MCSGVKGCYSLKKRINKKGLAVDRYSTWTVELVSAIDAIVSAVAEERPVYTTAVGGARPLAIRVTYCWRWLLVVSRPLDVMFDLQKVTRFQDEQGARR